MTDQPFEKNELLNIAKYQSAICWIVVVRIVMLIVGIFLTVQKIAISDVTNSVLNVLGILLSVAVIVLIYLLAKNLKKKAWLFTIGLFVPIVNIGVLLYLIIQATKVLRANGIRVGVMGANKEDLNNLLK